MVDRMRARAFAIMHACTATVRVCVRTQRRLRMHACKTASCPCSRESEVAGLIHSHEQRRRWYLHARESTTQQSALPHFAEGAVGKGSLSAQGRAVHSLSAPDTRAPLVCRVTRRLVRGAVGHCIWRWPLPTQNPAPRIQAWRAVSGCYRIAALVPSLEFQDSPARYPALRPPPAAGGDGGSRQFGRGEM